MQPEYYKDIYGVEIWYLDLISLDAIKNTSFFYCKVKLNDKYFLCVLHREDGPALVDPVSNILNYRRFGKLHRLDGPAYIGMHIKDYWIENNQFTFDDWWEYLSIEQRIAAMYNPENF